MMESTKSLFRTASRLCQHRVAKDKVYAIPDTLPRAAAVLDRLWDFHAVIVTELGVLCHTEF